MLYCAKALSDIWEVRIFGFGEEAENIKARNANNVNNVNNVITKADTLKDCVNNAEVIILPLPYKTAEGCINAPYTSCCIKLDDILSLSEKCRVLFCGRADENIKNLCKVKGITVYDYSIKPEFEILNAVPTAEGAIETAIRNTEHTIFGSRCLVTGYGRIGKALSDRLKGLGAEVSATARKAEDLAWIRARGIKAYNTCDIGDIIKDFDIVFNTIPYCVLDAKAVNSAKNGGLIIDLASRPGGVDLSAAKLREGEITVISALSLPGKTAPKTAGEIISGIIKNIADKENIF